MFDVTPLVKWYRETGRPLPWREDPTPYKVLLSELMCQQTRVETALPYFEAFLARWPDFEALAAAGEDAVVEAWAGLGYYSRARNLHRCAVVVVEGGGVPPDAESLRELPGIGPYTAGAISSIAFGRRAAAVDGNIQRVLSRLLALDAPPSSTPGRKALWKHARALHDATPPEVHPGDLNQALMELGARICTPRNPSCEACPLATGCEALEQGRVAEIPRPKVRKPPVPIRGVAGVWSTERGVLLVKRPQGGLLGGLWGPPVVMEHEGPDEPALVDAFGRAGLRVRGLRPVGSLVHVFSHRRLTASVYAVRCEGEPTALHGWEDVRFGTGVQGVSGLGRKILELSRTAGSQLSLLAADTDAP